MTTGLFDNTYVGLPERFYSQAVPDDVPAPELLAWNHELATELGLGQLASDDAQLARIFAGNDVPAGARPIALAYAGHQFGQFVPQLGDGRAVLLGEVIAADGRRFDVQLKGSGRTVFSRGGDGKSWLGPVIREYIVSEAMHRLGVPTTRALAAVGTGERVYREGPLPGGVLTRVAASHIRVGTFQYFAAREDIDGLRTLADYAITRHYPEASESETPYAAFFAAVLEAQAKLIAAWLALGFIHGVMNTDNTAISGETIDYGPCAFMDEYRADKVFSSIDRRGRYAYGQQPQIGQWNLTRLAECLLLIDDDRASYEEHLGRYPARFEHHYLQRMRAKLGFMNEEAQDTDLIREWLSHLQAREMDYTQSFRQLAGRLDVSETTEFGDFESKWRARLQRQDHEPAQVRASMDAVNPLYIPRNHRVEEAIDAAVDGDLSPFRELNEVLKQPFQVSPTLDHLATPPTHKERVTATFCGT